MTFVKLWLLGILAAVLVAAATPPSSAPVTVTNEVPVQQPAMSVPGDPPCPDTATTQVAAAEERINGLIERNRRRRRTLSRERPRPQLRLAAACRKQRSG